MPPSTVAVVMRRLLRLAILLGVLVGVVMWWTRRARVPVDVAFPDVPPTRLRSPWVEPDAGTCPTGYEIKAKLSSGIFHVPGMVNYARTTPDRCYASAEAAEADGLRPAKR